MTQKTSSTGVDILRMVHVQLAWQQLFITFWKLISCLLHKRTVNWQPSLCHEHSGGEEEGKGLDGHRRKEFDT